MPTETARRNVLHRRLDTVSRRRTATGPTRRHPSVMHGCSPRPCPHQRFVMNRLNADLILLAAAAIWRPRVPVPEVGDGTRGPAHVHRRTSALAAVALAPLAWREHAQAGAPMPRGLLPIACGGGLLFFVAAWLQQAGIRTATVTNTTSSPRSTSSSRRSSPGAGTAGGRCGGVARDCLIGVRHLAARRRGAQRALAGRHAGGAVGDILGRARRRHRTRLALWPSIGFTAIQFALVTVLAVVALLPLETVTLAGLGGAAVDIAYVGLLSSALTFTLLTVALRHTPPSEAVIIAASRRCLRRPRPTSSSESGLAPSAGRAPR